MIAGALVLASIPAQLVDQFSFQLGVMGTLLHGRVLGLTFPQLWTAACLMLLVGAALRWRD